MNLTPTEQRLFNILSDSQPHSLGEIKNRLDDGFIEGKAVRYHVMQLRRKLREVARGIRYERYGNDHFYSLIRILHSNSE